MVHRQAALTSPESLLEMQNLSPEPESEPALNKAPGYVLVGRMKEDNTGFVHVSPLFYEDWSPFFETQPRRVRTIGNAGLLPLLLPDTPWGLQTQPFPGRQPVVSPMLHRSCPLTTGLDFLSAPSSSNSTPQSPLLPQHTQADHN